METGYFGANDSGMMTRNKVCRKSSIPMACCRIRRRSYGASILRSG